MGWVIIGLKNFNEPISYRHTAVRVGRSKIKGCVKVGGANLFNANREIFDSEELALEAGERDAEIQSIVREAGWMKFDEEDPSDGLWDRVRTARAAEAAGTHP